MKIKQVFLALTIIVAASLHAETATFRILPLLRLEPGKAATGNLHYLEFEHDREDYTVRHLYFRASPTNNKPESMHYLNSFLNWGATEIPGYSSDWIKLGHLEQSDYFLLVGIYDIESSVIEIIPQWEAWVKELAATEKTWQVTQMISQETEETIRKEELPHVIVQADYKVGEIDYREVVSLVVFPDHLVVCAALGPKEGSDAVLGELSDLLFSFRDIRPISEDLLVRD